MFVALSCNMSGTFLEARRCLGSEANELRAFIPHLLSEQRWTGHTQLNLIGNHGPTKPA